MGTELDLISVSGSKLTWPLCGDRKVLGLSVWINILSVCVGGLKWARVQIGGRIDLSSVVASALAFFL